MSIDSAFAMPLIVVGAVIVAISVLMFVARRYHRCAPDEALVVFGRKSGDRGYRLITGGAAFVIPVLEDLKRLPLRTFRVSLQIENSPNKDGVPVNVDATANMKISSDPQILSSAVERLLSKDETELKELSKPTLEGLLRQIVGTLSIEDTIQDREALSKAVLNVAQEEMKKLGFQIDNFTIQKVWDDQGYIDALGRKRTAEVKRDAEIGEAEAKREATIRSSAARKEGEQKRLANEAEVAQAQRDLEIKQAEFKKATDTAKAEADLAMEMRRTQIESELTQRRVQVEQSEVTARIQVAEQKQQLTEKELVASVIRPAEAQREASIITAEGNAKANIRKAQADAEATEARAKAEKIRIAAEGEGRAQAQEAEARAVQARGEADAAARKAALLAEAEGKLRSGLADAEALLKKNEAYNAMNAEARRMFVLQLVPSIVQSVGDAGEKVVGSAFTPIAHGLAQIDNINILDMGNGANNAHGTPLERFALSAPTIIFKVVQQAQALGIDVRSLFKNVGIDADELLATMPIKKDAGEMPAVPVVPSSPSRPRTSA
jgi:flotillin